ncbi:MAG: hypothetical protein AAGA35_04275 [Patescibacteria group bacterium]
MKRFGQQLKKKSETIRLRASERADLRERLVSYMEYHPLPESMKQQKQAVAPQLVTEAYRTISLTASVYFRGAVGAIVLFVVVGVPLIAERSLPGDVLYPIKVQFNEEVRSTLTLSPYQKVEWETERLGRRIAEARLLASEGKLTEEFEAEVAEAVKAHSDAAQESIEEIRETDAEEAAIAEIAFSSALEVQTAVIQAEGDVSSTTVAVIAEVVEEESAEANENRTESENIPSIDLLLARVEIETTRAYELLESVRSIATPSEIIDIERRLSDIERNVGAAIGEREADDPDEPGVRNLLRDALQNTQKLISFMTDINVRETLVVQDLVPVELTIEERTQVVLLTLDQTAVLENGVRAALNSLEDEAVVEKVVFGLGIIEEQTNAASSSLQNGEIESAEAASSEALAVAEDLANVVGFEPNAVVPEPEIIEEAATSTEETAEEEVNTEETGTEESEEEDTEEAEEEIVEEVSQPVTEEIIETETQEAVAPETT